MTTSITGRAASLQRQRDAALRRAESLRRVIELISSELALAPLLTRIVASATELIGAQYGSVGLVRERSGGAVVEIAAAVNMPPTELGMEFPANVGLAGRVLRERQSLCLARYGDLEQVSIPEFADHTVIGIPIWWGPRIIGFFGIGAEPPRRFTAQDVETITLFARHAAIAIENARCFEQEQRRNERLALIAHVGRIITADLLIDELLQNTADAMHALLGYTAVTISLVRRTDMPQPDHTTGEQAAMVVCSQAAPAHDPHQFQARLGLPLLRGTQLLGTLEIAGSEPFADEDATSLRIIADQLVVAIEKAHLFATERRRSARIAAINRIGRVITGNLSSSNLFQAAVTAMYAAFHFDYAAVGIIDPDDPEHLILMAHAGRQSGSVPAGYRQPLHAGLVGVAARTRQQALMNSSSSSPAYPPISCAAPTAAALAVPIIAGSRLLGMIMIADEQAIDAEEAEDITIIADQFGAALENARLFGSMQQALEVTRLLYAASRRISTAMSVEGVILAYLEQVAARGPYPCAIVLLEVDPQDRRTTMTVRGRWSPKTGMNAGEVRWPYIEAAFTPLLDAGQTVTFANVQQDTCLPEVLRMELTGDGQLALAMIPLIVRGRRIGSVLLSCPHIHEWSAADLQPYETTAAQLATAIDSRQQHLLLTEQGEQIAVLEERRRLARELHDSVTQSLFSMSLLAQVIPDLWEIDRDEARQSLQQIRELTRSGLAEMRALLFELRPAATTEQSLAQALQQQVMAFEQRTRIPVVVEIQEEDAIPEVVQPTLLRITQEALMNIERHAHAQRVDLFLTGRSPMQLRISDDGQGFDPAQIEPGHFGLISMRERAAILHAHLTIRSAPGQGTTILFEWPTPNQS
ncbi:MAG: GAF domain-containing protein [Chloroflexaceae bacterium]